MRERTTPQVRPMRPARPVSVFIECSQKDKWDVQPVRGGTPETLAKGLQK